MTCTLFRRSLHRHSGSAGLTLIELLVVIVILGVLSGVVVFSVRGLGDKGRATARAADAEILRVAEEAYFARFNAYGTEEDLVREGFLSEPSTIHDIELGALAPNGRYAIVCAAGTACSPPPAPVRGGELVVAVPGPTTGSLNPAMTSDGSVHTNSEDMFNGLVRWSRTNEIEPELATSWVLSDADKRVTFTLRDGVFWHDDDPGGTRRPFTAADVEYTFDQVLLRYHSRSAASLGSALGVVGSGSSAVVPADAVAATGPLTVEMNLVYPYPNLLRELNVTEAPIIPRHLYEPCGADVSSLDGCPANRQPVGTGPFRFGSVTANEIRTVRNPAYFKPGLPYLDAVVKRVVRPPDHSEEQATSSEVQALMDGGVDVLSGVAGPDLERVTNDTTLRTFASPRGSGGSNCMSMLAFNLTQRGNTDGHRGGSPPPHEKLDDLRVRRAVAHAFDRAEAFTEIDGSLGRVADSPISSGIESAHAVGLPLPVFDPSTATTLLAEAGWSKDGPRGPLELDLHYLDNGYQGAYADALFEALDEVGVELEPRPHPDSEAYRRAVFAERAFDMALISYCNGEDPQAGVRRQYHSSQISTAAFSNAAGYKDIGMDVLWDQAAQAPSPAKYREIQEMAVEDLPYLWFAETLTTRAYRGGCTGLEFHNTGLFAEGAYCRPRD